MPDALLNPLAFDILSLLLTLKALQVAWRLRQAWPLLWGDTLSPEAAELAGESSFFLLIPPAVLAHELGHALATWQVGGEVLSFQWRVFWGYVVPAGDFTPLEYWWIALSGNLVSVALGLLPFGFLGRIRRPFLNTLWRTFAPLQLFYALVYYPAVTLAGFDGDWATIYDFSLAPYPQVVLVVHLVLLGGLWWLWRQGRNGAVATPPNMGRDGFDAEGTPEPPIMSDRSRIRAPEDTQATAQRIRRARDYTLVTHVVERLMERVGGAGWMAELAYRAGLQPPVVVDAVALRLPAPSADLPPLRIAFASDFHAGPTTHPTAITSACDALARLRN